MVNMMTMMISVMIQAVRGAADSECDDNDSDDDNSEDDGSGVGVSGGRDDSLYENDIN